ncbi:isocitrate/isopropylmalate dehydrogenase family protein [bacterium]|nr:isocitrate/isopropylmalate dehydrogenase family protein [bacterium]
MIRIAVLPGDGIGPEITDVAVRAATSALPEKIHWERFDEVTTRNYVEQGIGLDEERMSRILGCDAIFLGAVGDDLDLDHAARILLRLRFDLDLFVNLRPIRMWAPWKSPLAKTKGIDFVIVRENTEGFYKQEGGYNKRGTPEEEAWQKGVYTRKGTERVIRYAFELAVGENRQRVTMVDKSNVLRHGHQLWLDIFKEVSADYPQMDTEHLYVDAATMQLLKRPTSFGVIVTTNMFGDILSDLSAQMVGGLGLAPSANLHPGELSLFEPVHGSAPKYAGLDIANPLAGVLSMAMLLKERGQTEASLRLENAVRFVLKNGQTTRDLGGDLGTKGVGDALVSALEMPQKTPV